jgi:hypothetical protein
VVLLCRHRFMRDVGNPIDPRCRTTVNGDVRVEPAPTPEVRAVSIVVGRTHEWISGGVNRRVNTNRNLYRPRSDRNLHCGLGGVKVSAHVHAADTRMLRVITDATHTHTHTHTHTQPTQSSGRHA